MEAWFVRSCAAVEVIPIAALQRKHDSMVFAFYLSDSSQPYLVPSASHFDYFLHYLFSLVLPSSPSGKRKYDRNCGIENIDLWYLYLYLACTLTAPHFIYCYFLHPHHPIPLLSPSLAASSSPLGNHPLGASPSFSITWRRCFNSPSV